MKRVLFVCTGNTCRSSMAEAIARRLVEEKGRIEEFSVSSGGIYALPGDKASPQAVEALEEWGIGLGSHCARQVSQSMMDEADVILAMTAGHKRALMEMNPDAGKKVFTLREYADGLEGDITDPFGQQLDVYRRCAAELKGYISRALDRILNEQAP